MLYLFLYCLFNVEVARNTASTWNSLWIHIEHFKHLYSFNCIHNKMLQVIFSCCTCPYGSLQDETPVCIQWHSYRLQDADGYCC